MLTPPGMGGYRARRHRRRSVLGTLLVVVLTLGVLGAAGYGAWWRWLRADGQAAAPQITCPPTPTPPPPAQQPAKVTVNVYNATDRKGLAATAATALRSRGFQVGKVANDPLKHVVTGVAEVRYGPAGAGAARTVAATVASPVLVKDARADASVDLVLGTAYKDLNTPEQYQAALSPRPTPRPSGC